MHLLNLWIYCFLLCTPAFSLSAGTLKPNAPLPLPILWDGKTINSYATLDQNWRWWHDSKSTQNCYDKGWTSVCSSETECADRCQIEGVDWNDYKQAYGITPVTKGIRLSFLTRNNYGVNVGSRLYLLDESKTKYLGFDLRQKEFRFQVDLSSLECGLNAAVYFVELPLQDPYGVGSAYGVNYGDAQCASDIKWINGEVNFGKKGACSAEMDILESNKHAMAFTAHPCSISSVTTCRNDSTCGLGPYRFSGYCDRNGADYNSYRVGKKALYGAGAEFSVDTRSPFTVITQFWTHDNTSSGDLVRIVRYVEQNGKQVYIGELSDKIVSEIKTSFGETNHFQKLGGMKTMGESFARKMVLTVSLWDDEATQMQWLDSTYGGSGPGTARGPCPNPPRPFEESRKANENAFVTYSQLEVRSLSTTPPPKPPSPSPTQTPTRVPTTPKTFQCTRCEFRKVTPPPTNSNQLALGSYWKCSTCKS